MSYTVKEHSNKVKIMCAEKGNHLVILEQLLIDGFEIEENKLKIPQSLLSKVHNKDFIKFLQKISSSLGKNELLYPDVFLNETGKAQ